MRLTSFRVSGYKNFKAALRLEDIDRFTVIHGDNNVGKSNLVEAMALFFLLLDAEEGPSGGVASSYERRADADNARSFGYFIEQGIEPSDIFPLDNTGEPIRFHAEIAADDGARQAVSIELRRVEGALTWTSTPERSKRAMRAPRFALLRADRTLLSISGAGSAPTHREPLPKELGLMLFDGQEAEPGSKERERFLHFLQSLDSFRHLLGDGGWRVRYDRRAESADLVFESGVRRTPLRLMGSGVHQVVNIAARLSLLGADIVAIEEPELNLRYDAQLHLRDMLDRLAGGVNGPAQIFMTSHSPAFELAETFFSMRPSEGGPALERRPNSEARLILALEVEEPKKGASAPISYVTTEGLVRIPDKVRRALSLSEGGLVVFVPAKDGHYQMLTTTQFWDLFEEETPSS